MGFVGDPAIGHELSASTQPASRSTVGLAETLDHAGTPLISLLSCWSKFDARARFPLGHTAISELKPRTADVALVRLGQPATQHECDGVNLVAKGVGVELGEDDMDRRGDHVS